MPVSQNVLLVSVSIYIIVTLFCYDEIYLSNIIVISVSICMSIFYSFKLVVIVGIMYLP